MNHYEVLEIEASAGQRDIEKAFRRKARELHPDRHSQRGPEAVREATKAMAQLNEAFRVLRDPLDRQIYDSKLARRANRPIRAITSLNVNAEPALLFVGLILASLIVPFAQIVLQAGSVAIVLWSLVFLAATVGGLALWVLLSRN